jgi:ABC-2 type transport system ATP-binding protein
MRLPLLRKGFNMKLEVKNIRKSFGDKEILHGISFEVESGRALGLLGRNGAGKTTTIRIIMDVFHANSGEILLDGKKFKYDGAQVGYLPEERGLYPKRVIKEQLIYLGCLRGLSKKEAEANTLKWLEKLEVSEYKDRKLDTLSKGNQQKVQLASTLVSNPDIVILDEPFSGLDPVNAQILKDVISELIADGKIVIFSSHQMSYVEEFCEDIVIINKGEIALSGNLDKIKEEYGEGRKIISASNMEIDELEELIKDKLSDVFTLIGNNKHNVIVELKNGVDQWQALDKVKNCGIDIKSFGVYVPTLNDIFVARVGDEEVEGEDKETLSGDSVTDTKKKSFGRRIR